MFQRVAVCCIELQCVAVCCSVVCCSVVQCCTVCCSWCKSFSPIICTICAGTGSSYHCNMLQFAATCCNLLQLAATCCNILIHRHIVTLRRYVPCRATTCNTLQHTATHCDTLRHTATHCNTLQHTHSQAHHFIAATCSMTRSLMPKYHVWQCVAVCGRVLQRVAACCNMLQCVAVCCSALRDMSNHLPR